MKFIEMTGRQLRNVVTQGEFTPERLSEIGIRDDSILRINPQGDLELRCEDGWDLVGGLLGNYDQRAREATGLDWARSIECDE